MEEKKSFFKENGIYIILIIIVLIIKLFVVSPIRVNGASMNNTLYDKDIMILDEISYRFNDIKRFDIVVVNTKDEYLIKRVIGLPGETIKYEDNTLYTNDFEAVVPEGKYFVLGDNRTNSTDSRIIGPVTKNEIKGKTNLIIFPFSRFGNVK